MVLRPQPGLCWKRVISPTGCEVILAQEHLRFLILDGHPFHFNIGQGGRRDALRRVRVFGFRGHDEAGPSESALRFLEVQEETSCRGFGGVPPIP